MGALDDRVASDHATPQGESRAIVPSDHAVLVARFLSSLANGTRLRVLSVIVYSEDSQATVGEIADAVGLRQPSVTHHINILEEAGIVTRHPEGRQVHCRVVPEMLPIVSDLLA